MTRHPTSTRAPWQRHQAKVCTAALPWLNSQLSCATWSSSPFLSVTEELGLCGSLEEVGEEFLV